MGAEGQPIVVLNDAKSLNGFVSAGVDELSEALFESVPAAPAFSTTVMNSAEPPTVRLQMIGPVPLHVPFVGVAETNVPPLNESLIVTLAGVAGPRLPTFTE